METMFFFLSYSYDPYNPWAPLIYGVLFIVVLVGAIYSMIRNGQDEAQKLNKNEKVKIPPPE